MVRERVYRALLLLWVALGVLLWCFLFSWLFVPANLRPALLWLIWTWGLAIALLRVGYRGVFRSESFRSHFRIFPRWEAIERAAADKGKVFFRHDMKPPEWVGSTGVHCPRLRQNKGMPARTMKAKGNELHPPPELPAPLLSLLSGVSGVESARGTLRRGSPSEPNFFSDAERLSSRRQDK